MSAALYASALLEYKQQIKSNRFARELELKHHRRNHRPLVRRKQRNPLVRTAHVYPVESQAFTTALKSQLNAEILRATHVRTRSRNVPSWQVTSTSLGRALSVALQEVPVQSAAPTSPTVKLRKTLSQLSSTYKRRGSVGAC